MEKLRSSKPLELKILTVVIVGMILWNVSRLGSIIQSWNLLQDYLARSMLVYILVSTVLWILLGLFLLLPFWSGIRISRLIPITIISSYFIWFLIDRISMQYPQTISLLTWLANLIFFAITITLSLSKNLRQFFHDEK